MTTKRRKTQRAPLGPRTAILAAVAALALSGCGLECHPVDGTGAWEIDWRGYTPVPNVDRAIQIIVQHTPCASCLGWDGGRVSWWPDPFQCGQPPILVHGCMPWGASIADFAVGYATPLSASALPDEIGHYVWNACGLGIGEDAAGVYTPEFTAWLDTVRSAMRSEGL